MLCSQSFTTFAIYKHHIGDKHGLLIEDYRAKFGKVGEIINKFNCELCQQDMIHKNSTIKAHMKTIHNLSLSQYHSKFIKQQTKEEDISDLKAETKAVSTTETSEPEPEPDSVEHIEIENTNEVSNAVENIAEPDNEMSAKWFEGDHQYQCLICNANIAHKFNNISSHLNLIHDLSIQEYEQAYLNLEITHEITSKTDDQSFEIDEEQERDNNENEDEQPYLFTEADIIIEEEEVDDAEDETENVSEVNGEICAGADSEHAWYHGSNLTCQICSKTFANDQWYFHHFSKIHGMTKEQYNEQYGKELEIWHQYQCLICNSEIRSKIYYFGWFYFILQTEPLLLICHLDNSDMTLSTHNNIIIKGIYV